MGVLVALILRAALLLTLEAGVTRFSAEEKVFSDLKTTRAGVRRMARDGVRAAAELVDVGIGG